MLFLDFASYLTGTVTNSTLSQEANNFQVAGKSVCQNAWKLQLMPHIQLLNNFLVLADHSFFTSRTYHSFPSNGVTSIHIQHLSYFVVNTNRSQLWFGAVLLWTMQFYQPQSSWHPEEEGPRKIPVYPGSCCA